MGNHPSLVKLESRLHQGTASGLARLYHGCWPQVIHYDLKSTMCYILKTMRLAYQIMFLPSSSSAWWLHIEQQISESALGYMAPEFVCSESHWEVWYLCLWCFALGALIQEPGKWSTLKITVLLYDHIQALLGKDHLLSLIESKLHKSAHDDDFTASDQVRLDLHLTRTL
jgi:hypothetical protein